MKVKGSKWLSIVAILVTLAVFPLQERTVCAKSAKVNTKVATVNGTPITQAEFNRELARVLERFQKVGHPLSSEQMAKVKESVLNNLIARELLYQESKKKGIKVDKAAVDKQVADIRKNFSSDKEFKDTLKKANITEASLRSQVKEGIAIQELVDRDYIKKIKVSEKEAKQYYDSHPNLFKQPERVRASHILVKVGQKATKSDKAKARKKIEDIQKKLRKGGDFAKLAKEYSEGPSSSMGGDLGYFSRGQMVKPFEEAAFSLKPGQVSGVVETRYGYHLIKVTDKKPETKVAFKDVRVKLEEFLKQQKVQEAVQKHVGELKKKAKIKTFITTSKNG